MTSSCNSRFFNHHDNTLEESFHKLISTSAVSQTVQACQQPAQLFTIHWPYNAVYINHPYAAWLAQLVERQSAVQEVNGSSPRPDQHSGS